MRTTDEDGNERSRDPVCSQLAMSNTMSADGDVEAQQRGAA